jgi:hypothetical protein
LVSQHADHGLNEVAFGPQPTPHSSLGLRVGFLARLWACQDAVIV